MTMSLLLTACVGFVQLVLAAALLSNIRLLSRGAFLMVQHKQWSRLVILAACELVLVPFVLYGRSMECSWIGCRSQLIFCPGLLQIVSCRSSGAHILPLCQLAPAVVAA